MSFSVGLFGGLWVIWLGWLGDLPVRFRLVRGSVGNLCAGKRVKKGCSLCFFVAVGRRIRYCFIRKGGFSWGDVAFFSK